MSQTVATSGIGPSTGEPYVYITYTLPQLPNGFTGDGEKDYVPGFMYLGEVVYQKDRFGNLLAKQKNADGSTP